MSTVPVVKDVLLVGFGAVGAICASIRFASHAYLVPQVHIAIVGM
jgi:hypothetical protein